MSQIKNCCKLPLHGYPCVCLQKTQPPLICFCPLMLFVSALFNPLWMVDSSAHLSAQARLKVHWGGPCNGWALRPRNQACYLWTIRLIMLTWAQGEARKVPVTLVALPRIYLLVEVATVDFIIPLAWSYNCYNINFGRRLGTKQARLFFYAMLLMQIR